MKFEIATKLVVETLKRTLNYLYFKMVIKPDKIISKIIFLKKSVAIFLPIH